MTFEFESPQLLWLLLALPILALLRGARAGRASVLFSSVAIAKTAAKKSRGSPGKWLFFLRLLCLALLIVAIARPRLGSGYSEREESGIDIVLALDVSGSMAALDFTKDYANPITRLDAVKEVVADFVKKRPNDRIGVYVFGANTFLLSPITLSHDWLTQNLERVQLGIVDGSRTAIGMAIANGANKLKELKNSKSKVIILLTDGENNSGKISPLAAAEAAASLDIKIYTIMAGKSGIIPFAQVDDNGALIRDRRGRPMFAGNVQSYADDAELKKIAEITHGKFYRAENLRELNEIYSNIDKLEKTSVKLRQFTSYTELFYIFAAAALAVLALEQILANTKYRRIP